MRHGDQEASIPGSVGDPKQYAGIADTLQPAQREFLAQSIVGYGVTLCREAEERFRTAADRAGARLDVEQLALTVAQRYLPGLIPKNMSARGLGAVGGAGAGGGISESRR